MSGFLSVFLDSGLRRNDDPYGVESVGAVKLRWIGHKLHAEVDATVSSDLSVVAAHDIAENAHHALLHDVPRLTYAIVHANPSSEEGQDRHAAIAHHFDG